MLNLSDDFCVVELEPKREMPVRRGALQRKSTKFDKTVTFDVIFDEEDCQMLCELDSSQGFLIVDKACQIRMKGLWQFTKDLQVDYKNLSFGDVIFFKSH